MLVSILIPAYKEERNIKRTILTLKKHFRGVDFAIEIIIVCDGINDRTFSIASKYRDQSVKVFAYTRNQGKGYALRHAFNKSSGDVIVFFDAGLDFPPQDIFRFVEYQRKTGLPAIIGSKKHQLSKIHYPTKRKIISRCGQIITKILFGLNVRDTQVGLKIFRRDVLSAVFPRMVVKRYAFDIELLVLVNYFGYPIVEAPINLQFNSMSSSVGVGAVSRTLQDTLGVFYRLRISRFYDRLESPKSSKYSASTSQVLKSKKIKANLKAKSSLN